MFRILRGQGLEVTEFHHKFAVQLNDTHPAIAVAELMRLLMDVHGVDWDTAWSITTARLAMRTRRWGPSSIREMRCRIWKSPG